MSSVTRRDVIRIITASAVAVVVGPRTADAAEEKPLTPETIVAKKFEGRATVEFQVGGEGTGGILGGSIKYAGTTGIHLCPIEQPKGDDVVRVWILTKPAHDLFRLGIDPGDPGEHFRGKVIRVKGQITRITRKPYNSGTVYELQVESLDQIEEVRKAKP